MAENKNIEVGGRLHSIATGNVLAGANEVLDDAKGKKQSVINAENDIQLASHESRLNAYTEGKFVTVSNYSALPATGAVDTVYRVSSWDGTANNGQGAVDVTKYSEYAWQNGAYKFLDVKTQIGEVFDISEYNSGAVYTDLANALGNNGINVPPSIRRGGMSVKFKQVITPATYTVVKTEGATEQPTGTEIQSDPGIISGTYTAGELSVFSTLPATLNSSLTYYLTVTETVDEQEVITYTTWVITYAQSSDNKYVQVRCMADSFTTDTTQWVIADDGVYVENPEYVYVKTDAEGKILWAIKTDGGIYYGAGCPQQIIDYIEKKIAELSLDEYEDIVAFLSDYLGSDTTLKVMIDGINAQIATKVNKEEGKSLIDADYAEGVGHVENSEFAEVHTDADNKILYGVKQDGDFYFGAGVPSQIQKELENKVDKEEGKSLIDAEYASTKSTIESSEFIEVTTDSEDKVLEGIQLDGTKIIGGDLNVDGSAKILGEMEVAGISYKVIENPEYLAAWVDVEDKVIFGLKRDGKTYVGDADFLDNIEDIKAFLANFNDKNIDWDALTSITTTESPEYIEATTDLEGKLLAGRTPDGAAFENVGFFTPKLSIDGTIIDNNYDKEGRIEVKTDSEGKIISYRDAAGVKHEEVGIETNNATVNHLNLTESGMTEFQQSLKDAGFNPGCAIDLSKSKFVELPIPDVCAYVNISANGSLPKTDGTVLDGFLEYYDFFGNYFKKPITGLEIQGDSSKIMPFKNYKFDLDDDSTIKFDNWVPQDSFHLKKYYIDNFRGQCIIGYWLAEQMYQSRDFGNRKPYEYLYKNNSMINSNGKMSKDFYSGAMCHPDGFPIKMYFNGELVGLYTFNLKKDRDNYAMKKDNTAHIILDGSIESTTMWGGTVVWGQFEIRNPKPKKKKDGWELVDIDNNAYDGDNPTELMGTTTPGYDSTNQSHVKSAETKAIIERLSGAVTAINAADTTAAKKEVFESYFKVDECIDYFLFGNFTYDYDGFRKNWIWCTWDGLIWSPTYYDKDSIFGIVAATGLGIVENSLSVILEQNNTNDPIGLVYQLYRDEVIARYNELKQKGIFTKENVVSLFDKWIAKVGYDNLKEELEDTCPETPSYRKNNLYDGWIVIGLENKALSAFDSTKTYNEGEKCWFTNMTLKATKTIEPHESPIETPYELYPYGGGFYNSVQRIYNWLNNRLSLLDSEFV